MRVASTFIQSQSFCSVFLENIWLIFRRVKLKLGLGLGLGLADSLPVENLPEGDFKENLQAGREGF